MRLRRGRHAGNAAPLPGKTLHAVVGGNIRQVVRNVVVRHDGVVEAGYRMGPVRWDYTGVTNQQITLDQVTDGWANLVGRDMRERVTTRPHPVADWARRLDSRTPHPVPDVASWNEHLARMQHRISRAGMDDKITVRFFTIGEVEGDVDVRGEIGALLTHGTEPSEAVRALLGEEKRVADAVTHPGWGGRRMTPAEIAWTHQRSTAPGMPAPFLRANDGGWDETDLGLLVNDVRWFETPWDRTVEVRGWRDGAEVVRHVQVLTCARLEDLHYPHSGLEPWQAFAERAVDSDGVPFAVEWNIVGRLHTGEELAARVELDRRRAIHVQRQYEDFDEPPPAYTERGIVAAAETEDQVTTGQARDASRFVGTVNIIVSGSAVLGPDGRVQRSAAEVVEERADVVRRLYGGNELRMQFTPAAAQAARLAEAVPGEAFERKGYQRQVRLPYLAAGLPNVSTTVGDGHGPYLGYTRGAARRAVQHDPHFATEGRGVLGRGNNMWPVIGALGSGKSVLTGAIAYNAARRGVKVIIRDPSGPMMALCGIPEIAPHSRAVDLLRGEPGTLNVPSLVREPTSDEFAADGTEALAHYDVARQRARAERAALVTDVARRMLESDLYSHAETLGTLRDAARAVAADGTGWTVHRSLWDLVGALRSAGSSHAGQLADALQDASQMPVLSLLFPVGHVGGDHAGSQHTSVLTVISTPGIRRAPDEVGRSDWSADERSADVVLRLTALYADRELFGKQRDQRAIAIFDEAEDLTDSGVGRGYLSRLGRDHSKWNIAVYLALKSLSEQVLSGELRNFVAGAFIGRQANLAVAETMLEILNITDKAYARSLMRLSEHAPGEFVHLDAQGNVGGIKVDIDYHRALHDALMTNPEPEGSDAWRAEVPV